MLKRHLKNVLWKTAPSLMALRSSYYNRRRVKDKFWSRQCDFARQIYGEQPIHVIGGPFHGLKYINETVWGPIEPKWLGSYEQELHGAIHTILHKTYDTIIDIGSAEGYYSVGLAHKLPRSNVYSYEIDPWSRTQQKRLANINGVSNLQIQGICTHKELDKVSTGRTLIVCDIEGSEFNMLDPLKSQKLIQSDILVELHNSESASISEMESEFQKRFQRTHSIEIFQSTPRSLASLARKENIPADLDIDLLNEHRIEGQIWLWMQSHHLPAVHNDKSHERS